MNSVTIGEKKNELGSSPLILIIIRRSPVALLNKIGAWYALFFRSQAPLMDEYDSRRSGAG